MVVPLAAAAAARIGPAARSVGSSMMRSGSAGTRSMGGKLLGTSDYKIAKKLNTIVTNTKNTVAFGKKIFETTRGILGFFARHSPALQQQLIILNKSFSLFMRPIGDIMAKYVRVAAIWMIKLAMKWYNLFPGAGGTGSKAAIQDEIEGLESEKITALAAGDTKRADEIQKRIDELKIQLSQVKDAGNLYARTVEGLVDATNKTVDYLMGWGEVAKEWAIKIWDDYIVPGWQEVKDWSVKIWDDYIKPGWESIKNWSETIWTDYVQPGFEPMKDWSKNIWDEHITPGWEGVKTWAKDIWHTHIVPGFDDVKNFAKYAWDNFFVPGFESVKTWGQKLWDLIKSGISSFVDKIKSWLPGEDDEDDNSKSSKKKKAYASGGQISETGLYKLHAGERVIPAGINNEYNNPTSTNRNTTAHITNHFNIQAEIKNDMDIKSLARKLAELQETQLRRRVSYV